MKRSLLAGILLLAAGISSSHAQGIEEQKILQQYIRIGLDSNLALHRKDFDLQKARIDLQRAQSLFYPQAALASQYTLAMGGRTQDIPIGDLLNGAYTTLNQLTGANKFPQVANQSIQFLPNDFHDTRVEVTMPVVNTDLRYNRQMKKELINSQQAEIDIYKRDLVRSIKTAYYQYLQTGKAVEIYTNALALANENLRVSNKFLQNSMTTKEPVLRAQAQVSQVTASLIAANNQQQNALAYFNFLLNRPLEAAVTVDSSIIERANTSLTATVEVPLQREELAKLKSAQKVVATNIRLNRSYHVPKLNAFYNIGFQGFGFRFNGDQFYQLGGLQFRWDLFKANDNKHKIRQSEIDLESLQNQYADTELQLSLQVRTAYNDYRSAVQLLQARQDEVQSSQETYRFTERRFREGQALQIELIDARSQLTSARLNASLAQLAVLTRAAELERVTASYTF